MSLALEVIYQTKNFLVINKPAGLTVHGGPAVKSKLTLVDWLVKNFPEIKSVGEDGIRPGIVHRLDKDTSGLMVVALNQAAFLKLKQQFQARKILKIYQAEVWGSFKNKAGVLKNYLARHPKNRLKRIVVKHNYPNACEAETHYRVLSSLDARSRIRLSLKTGRTHQIRCQLADIKHPVVNDKRYGFRRQKFLGDGQLRLTAKVLGFSLDNKIYRFEI